jgi:ankyrin repeat protein
MTELNIDSLIAANYDKIIACYPEDISKDFTILMKLVLMTREYPYILSEIIRICDEDHTIINYQIENGWTALMIAACHTDNVSTEETVALLIKLGADLNIQDNLFKRTALMMITDSNVKSSENTIRILIDAGADVNIQDNDGWTALMYAANEESDNIVTLLINAGADVNIKDNDGWTALMFAIREKSTSDNIVNLLINAGADVNIKDNDGWTALMFAVRKKSTSDNIVKLLINAGADVNIKDTDSWTALMHAVRYTDSTAYENIIRILINAGAELNVKTNNLGRTALMLAVLNQKLHDDTGHAIILKILIDAGADLNVIDKSGQNILMIAHNKSNIKLKILIEAGINIDAIFVNDNIYDYLSKLDENIIKNYILDKWKNIIIEKLLINRGNRYKILNKILNNIYEYGYDEHIKILLVNTVINAIGQYELYKNNKKRTE